MQLFWGEICPLLCRSLVSLEPHLDARRFFRANRQQVLNLDFVEGVSLAAGGRLRVRLRGGPDVVMSRRQARMFRTVTSV